jgi:tetratricopeptide (TPR) repeat protein
MYLRALSICEKDTDADKSEVATILTNLASLYCRQANYGQAEPLYKKAQKIWDEFSGLIGNKHPNTVLTLEGMAMLYRKTGQEVKAAPLEKRAAAIRIRKAKSEHRGNNYRDTGFASKPPFA